MESLQERADSLRQKEANLTLLRNTIYDDLLAQIETLQNDLEQAKNAEKHYYNLMNQATQENRDLQKAMDRDRFVIALIDGDSMPFLDSFVARGFIGGVDVGRQLRQVISDYHQTNPHHRGDDKIVIYISANLHGLSRAYKLAGIVPETSVVRSFFLGVNQSHSLTGFVDAGCQKEAADSRLRAQMELYYSNTHCQQVIFVGSDSGYAPFLDTFAKAKDINKKIVVLNSPHMPNAMHRTLSQFTTTTFPNIFRSTKISVSTPSSNTLSGIKRSISNLDSLPDHKPLQPSYHGAKIDTGELSSHQNLKDTRPEDEYHPEHPFLVEEPPAERLYYVNEYGQRLDLPLVYDQQYLRYLFQKKARLCNNFYLKDFCPYGDSCSWDHSESLTPLQLDTLRHKARTSACRDPYCSDVGCTLGHICPRSAGECAIEACKFLPQQHNLSCAQIFEVNPLTGQRTKYTGQAIRPGTQWMHESNRRMSMPLTTTEPPMHGSTTSSSDTYGESIAGKRGFRAIGQGGGQMNDTSQQGFFPASEITARSALTDLIATYGSVTPSKTRSRNLASDYFASQDRD